MITAQTFTFNATPLTLGPQFSQPENADFPGIQCKYAELGFVYPQVTDYIRKVLDSIPIQGNHKHIVVDIKVTQIAEGQPPCLPGWHCDTVIDPYDPRKPEVHHLFVSGDASRTEFISQPTTLEVPSNLRHQQLLKHFRDQIADKDVSFINVPSCQIVTYGRFDFHRGSLGLFEEKRLLVRATETDVITPKNHLTPL